MKPAICTSFDYTIPFPEAVRMIAAAGFEVVSLGANPRHSGYATASGRAAIRALLNECGMRIDAMHAPFPEGDRLFSLDEVDRLESIRQCRLALDAAADLGSGVVAIHLIQPYDVPHGDARNRMIDEGRRSVGKLVAYAARRGVKLAFENGQKADYDQVVARFLEEFARDHAGFCYDSGHENVQGACFRMLERFGDRLLTVHLHDNRGTDTHILPYEGTIPWDRFRAIFHALNYPGNLVLETGIANSEFKKPTVFLAEARQRAERLLQCPRARHDRPGSNDTYWVGIARYETHDRSLADRH